MFGFVRPAACRSSAPRSVTDGCPYPPLPRRAKNRNKIQLFSHRKQEINENGLEFFYRCTNSFHRCGGPPPSRREVFGVENRRSVECRRARIARPFIPDVITTLREGARRVIGATAKPLYAIDGKAEGLDRRSPQTSLLEGGGPPAGGGRSKRSVEGVLRRWKSYRISQIKIYASKRRTMRGLAAHFNLISYLIRRGQSIPCLFLVGTPAQDEKN